MTDGNGSNFNSKGQSAALASIVTFKLSPAWRDFIAYSGLVMVMTVPFWLAGYLVEARLMPGLSVAAFAIVIPIIVASIVVASRGGPRAIGQLFASLLRPGRNMTLFGAAAMIVPFVVAALSWSMLDPNQRGFSEPLNLISLLPLFLVAAIAEEIGWSAFATRRLVGAVHPITIGLAVGAIWAIWHIPALIGLERSGEWIAWWSLWTLAQRTIMVAVFVRSRYWIWGPVLFHASSNLAWQAAPDSFDPRTQGLIMTAFALGALLLTFKKAS